MLRGSSGFYTYAIYERMNDWPGFSMGETRITFKLNKQWYKKPTYCVCVYAQEESIMSEK